MSNTFYKPLTPDFRENINNTIDRNIAELNTCKHNAFTNMQIISQEALKKLINALPDGYPIPVEEVK